ncbi:MAG: protein kinase [Akkermansiaceae bacterium]|jgi:tetratricopeptide (TPR) repeat protein
MEPPSIKGHTIEAEIGRGSAGVVYEAQRDDGVRVAIKVFESMASNPALIRARMSRIMDAGAQSATVPIIAEALEVRPACIVMPLLAEMNDEPGYRLIPRTLQTHLASYLANENSWDFVVKLAARLAAIHGVRVAHGNLKPGNIFIDEAGQPLLADYASGLMPGVHHLSFSDALLYAAPEQLRSPDSYLEEAGYRWDVFAFGVLAFRLVTGKFPRCQSIFEGVCPAAGDQQQDNIEADYEGIAAGLEEDPMLEWPTPAADMQEELRREIITFCLSLDPNGRPADMRGVLRRFETIDSDLAAEAINEDLVAERKIAEKRHSVAAFFTKVLALIALGFVGIWAWTEISRKEEASLADQKFTGYERSAVAMIQGLEDDVIVARSSQDQAISKSQKLGEALANEQDKAKDELRSAQLTNDELFRWILEKGLVGLPTLENRQGRLALLAEKIAAQLEGMADRADLAKQTAILRVRQAELILAAGELNKGRDALEVALSMAGDDLNPIDEVNARLRHLLLLAEDPNADLSAALQKSESLVKVAWHQESPGKLRAEAALFLVKGRVSEREGDTQEALDHFSESLTRFKNLADQYPETPALRMTLGRGYLESALAAEGGGAMQDAASLKAKAAEAFVKLAKSSKKPIPEVDYQIASANAARAVAEWQKGNSFVAEEFAKIAIADLTTLLLRMPGDFRVVSDLASQQGIVATAMRDAGRTTDASKLLAKAISDLEAGIDEVPGDYRAKYLLGSLKWQLSGIVGQKGESSQEIKLGTEARDLLALILNANVRIPQPAAVRKSLAYLCGDLGHAADLSGRRELAISLMKESEGHWETLLKADSSREEAREGLAWVKQRLGELGVK